MSALDRLRRVRGVLIAGVFLRAALWGTFAAISMIAIVAIADAIAPVGLNVRVVLRVIAILAGLVVGLTFVWRDRRVRELDRVALWIEERVPALSFALVTAVEFGDPTLLVDMRTSDWTTLAWHRGLSRLLTPLVALVAATVVLLALPSGVVARAAAPRRGDSLSRASRTAANRIDPLVAELRPPVYSGARRQEIDEPRDVRALVGSVLTLRGRGDAGGIIAIASADTTLASADADRWQITLRVSAKPLAIRLTDGTHVRIIAVEPIVDAPPQVALTLPVHDSVLRVPSGRLPLAAEATDDYAIASASFEYIVSSGEGETFTFKSGVLGAVHSSGKQLKLSATLSLDSLHLKPGDIVHLRAVARDANDVTGPGVGASETRAIRIARAGEYDSVAVDAAAPPDAEQNVVSERMLIMLAEALEKQRPRLARDSVRDESHAIGVDQKKLRRAVGDVVFTRLGGAPTGEEHTDESPERAKTMQEMLARADSATNRSIDPVDFEGGESPVVAVNKPLLEAYNAMWDASTALELGDPGAALPHMRRALAAIQKARAAERLYLRGAPPPVVIDIDKARLKGKDKGASSTRRPEMPIDSVTSIRANRLDHAIEIARTSSSAAADSLLLLRVDALADAPAFASALGDAAAAVRRGDGAAATDALARARRALVGAPIVRDSLSRWGIIP